VSRRTGVVVALAAASAALLASAGVATATDGRAAKTNPVLPPVLPSEAVGESSVRFSGADRYETSAEVSRLSWSPEQVTVVHLASGESPADALSMAASTLELGPLLLTRRDSLPPAVEAELQRLAPCLVVVVGGPAAVSEAVAERAASYADPQVCGG